MSDSNRKRIALAEETSFGVGPSPLNMLTLGVTGQSLRYRVPTAVSRTIRSDRNVQQVVRVGRSVGGGLPMEMTFPVVSEAWWYLLRAITCAASETAAVTIGSCTTVDASNTIARASGSFISDGVEVGDIVKIGNSLTASNNIYCRVMAVSALALTMEANNAFTTNGSCTVTRGTRLKNGTTARSFAVEVASLDVPLYQLFRGMTADSLDINVADGSIPTASIGFEGKTATEGGPNGASYTDATSTSLMDVVATPIVSVAGASMVAKSFGISIRNGVAGRTQVGALGPQSMRYGTFGVDLSLQTYHANFVEIPKFAAGTPTDFWTVLTNGANQALAISIPKLTWTDLGADTAGPNQDDYETGRATASFASGEGNISLRVLRFV